MLKLEYLNPPRVVTIAEAIRGDEEAVRCLRPPFVVEVAMKPDGVRRFYGVTTIMVEVYVDMPPMFGLIQADDTEGGSMPFSELRVIARRKPRKSNLDALWIGDSVSGVARGKDPPRRTIICGLYAQGPASDHVYILDPAVGKSALNICGLYAQGPASDHVYILDPAVGKSALNTGLAKSVRLTPFRLSFAQLAEIFGYDEASQRRGQVGLRVFVRSLNEDEIAVLLRGPT